MGVREGRQRWREGGRKRGVEVDKNKSREGKRDRGVEQMVRSGHGEESMATHPTHTTHPQLQKEHAQGDNEAPGLHLYIPSYMYVGNLGNVAVCCHGNTCYHNNAK